jgi:hypothetical protein
MSERNISAIGLYSLMLAMVATGTCNTLFMKSQNLVKIGKFDDEGKEKGYEHPFF